MTAPSHTDPIPRKLLAAMFGLALISLMAVAAVRLAGIPIRAADAPATQVRALRFEDAPTGAIKIIDARSNQVVQMYSGEGGFLRGALRALARERRRAGLGPDLPFELIARADGRLTLFDPATQERVDLEAFGPSNSGVFAALLAVPANQ